MTVAAVILAATPASALADADGLPSVRRMVDAAWSGGAIPVVVVAHDPDGAVAAALTGASATLAEPAPIEQGPAGQMARGIDVASTEVRETTAALLWPARFVWVGPETVTSLIEAHGLRPTELLRPTYAGEVGWPVLLPVTQLGRLRDVPVGAMPDDVIEHLTRAGAALERLPLGDPGVVHDRSVAPADLPPYDGPPTPPAEHAHEWGAAVADEPEDAPGRAPLRVPYPSDGEAG